MSDENTQFNCYNGGDWKKVDGELSYEGGEMFTVECPASELFSMLIYNLNVDLYGKTVWYVLPYEDVSLRKDLTNVNDNFKKMCEVALWVKSMLIFISPAVDDEGNSKGNGELNDGGKVADKGNGVGDGEQFPEEARVESAVADFFDEPEDDGNLHTPLNSDGEEDEDNHSMYTKGSGELKLGQVFGNVDEFKDVVVDYVLKEGWNIMYGRSETVCCVALCGSDGNCPWRIYCAFEVPLGKYMVKTFEDTHSCVKNGRSTILNQTVIAKLFINDLRYDASSYMPRMMQEQIQLRWKLTATTDQCKKARKIALDLIQLEHEEQFSKLKDYRLEILESNPGSSCYLDTIPVEDKGDIFHRFYVCFDVLKTTWRSFCRPIIGIDGCFLKCTTKGQLLAAVGRDANNQMYPVAWAVVGVENEENWHWFIQKVKADLCLGEGDGFALISDRQKGLLNAVQELLPRIEHRMCARHIYGNLKKAHPNKPAMKKLFWKVAKSYNKAEYDRKIAAMKEFDMRMYEDMMAKNPQNCSRAFFSNTSVCDDVHNNISESFNHAVDPAREMPMVEMLETIRRRAMLRIDIRHKKALKHTGKVSLKAAKLVQLEQAKIGYCRVFTGSNGWYQVLEKTQQYKVHMRAQTCTCRKWEMSGIPCRHALKIISENKWNSEDFISCWYFTELWRKIYGQSILPLNGSRFWRKAESTPVAPPERQENRKKKAPKRKKGKNESPTKKTKVSRKNRVMHCSKCGTAGHRAPSCTKGGEAKKWPPKKKKTKTLDDGAQSIAVQYCESTSQPTQNSVTN